MTKTLPVLALSALTVFAFTGCSTDNSDSTMDAAEKMMTDTSSPSDTSDPADTLRMVADGLSNGDDAVCALMSEKMQKMSVTTAVEVGIVDKGATCEDYVAGLPAYLKEAGVTTKSVVKSAKVDSQTGDKAVATIVVTNEGVKTTNSYNLVNVDGQWLIDTPITGSMQSE